MSACDQEGSNIIHFTCKVVPVTLDRRPVVRIYAMGDLRVEVRRSFEMVGVQSADSCDGAIDLWPVKRIWVCRISASKQLSAGLKLGRQPQAIDRLKGAQSVVTFEEHRSYGWVLGKYLLCSGIQAQVDCAATEVVGKLGVLTFTFRPSRGDGSKRTLNS